MTLGEPTDERREPTTSIAADADPLTSGDRLTPGDPLMSIGTFSRASLVSVKALRSYHELGLLIPASVDPVTGYRSYAVSQLADATIVKRLRDLDVPLCDIAEVVGARDPAVTRRVIEQHEHAMRGRLAELTRIVDELHAALDRPETHTPVHVRVEPPFHALAFTGFVDDAQYGPFLDHAFRTLYEAVGEAGASMSGPSAARYPAEVDTEREPVEALLPIAEPVTIPEAVRHRGVALTLVPSATVAVLTHAGGYDTVGEAYRRLGAWVARHASPVEQPVREHYVVSVDPETGQLLPDDRLRTEIAWPIEPDDHTEVDPTEADRRTHTIDDADDGVPTERTNS
ncbi:MAG: MerR family transcriptional regulator [Actinomycetota bacterium]